MHDIRLLRQNPDLFDASWSKRGLEVKASDLLDIDEAWRSAETRLQALQSERNEISKQIGQIKKSGGDAEAEMERVTQIKTDMADLEAERDSLQSRLNLHLEGLPNLLAGDVPDGADESENREIRKIGTPRFAGQDWPDHVSIGEGLGMLDFEAAAKMSGSRFALLHGGLARLERALGQFMIDVHTQENGYTEVSPPLLVKDNALFGTGQLPKFADQQFKTTSDHWLIPTAEVSLTNMVADQILDSDTLPLRLCALTPCFRSEAGAAGRDTRGMIRLHQFYKVEMVSITSGETAKDEHERMTACAEDLLKRLDLAYRTVLLCTGDTGFSAQKTYDLEVWLPGQQAYREISSCSHFGDFQARRMNTRWRKRGEKSTEFVHTLNGSGLAVGRTLVAILENYYDPADGGLFIPDVLKPYMGGLEKLLPLDAQGDAKAANG